MLTRRMPLGQSDVVDDRFAPCMSGCFYIQVKIMDSLYMYLPAVQLMLSLVRQSHQPTREYLRPSHVQVMGCRAEHGTGIIASQILDHPSSPGYPQHQAPYSSLSNRNPSSYIAFPSLIHATRNHETLYRQSMCPMQMPEETFVSPTHLAGKRSMKSPSEQTCGCAFTTWSWKLKTRCAGKREYTQPCCHARSPSAAAFFCLPSWASLCR